LLYLCTRNHSNTKIMSIDTYKLTSMEEPTDEVLSQLMREAAEARLLFRMTDGKPFKRYTDDIPLWAQTIID